MSDVRSNGSGQIDAADPLSFAAADRDRHVIAMVEDALREGNTCLAYQPIMTAGESPRVAFYEALIRVLDRTGRIIPAKDFIGQVENTEIGRRIDAMALKLGFEALAAAPTLRLSVNMSARSIDHPLWMKTLEDHLSRDDTLAERLIIEITESSAITMPDLVEPFMSGLQDRGISFALDDFGSGYTSIRYLKRLCFDVLKIDGEFSQGVAEDADNRALVRAMISIGRHFDMLTVAEAVETAEDAAVLSAIGVDCLQGYFFSAPSVRPPWMEEDRAAVAT